MSILLCTLHSISTKHPVRRCVRFFALAFAPFLLWANLSAQTADPILAVTEAPPPTVSPAMDALVRARKIAEKYFEQASNVVCTENVTQALVGKNGKANYREDSVFEYQMQASTNSGSLKLVESRDTRKAAFRDSGRSLLITNGFNRENPLSPSGLRPKSGHTLLSSSFVVPPQPSDSASSGLIFARNAVRPKRVNRP